MSDKKTVPEVNLGEWYHSDGVLNEEIRVAMDDLTNKIDENIQKRLRAIAEEAICTILANDGSIFPIEFSENGAELDPPELSEPLVIPWEKISIASPLAFFALLEWIEGWLEIYEGDDEWAAARRCWQKKAGGAK